MLSELPIAECTQSSTNKSLLFHPRVAEEASNLLQTRDESLALQLVSALRQTNSINIELKDEFNKGAEDPKSMGNNAPLLLQAVQQIDPNVFQYQALQMQQEQSYLEQQQCQYMQPEQPPRNESYMSQPQPQYDESPVDTAAAFQPPQLFSPANMIQQEQQQQPGPSSVTNNIYQTPNNHVYQQQQQQQQVWSQQDTMLGKETASYNHQPPVAASSQNHMVHNILASPQQPNVQQPPRNNDYLQQPQQKPSPAQASTAPETSQINNNLKNNQNHRAVASTVTPPKANWTPFKQTSLQQGAAAGLPTTVGMLEALRNSATIIQAPPDENNLPMMPPVLLAPEPSSLANEEIDIAEVEARFKLKMPVITVKALGTQDATILQSDIKSFIKNEPEKAAELGVSDMFSKIKAEEDRRNLKRPSLEEIVSQPKLRRVEKKLAPVVQKLAAEELMKTTNYQRFMQFMNQILEELDETEAVVSLDDDDNAEVIPMRLLTSISGECQKLKARNAIEALPENKLTLLISYAMRSVHTARNLSAGPEIQDDGDLDDAVTKILEAAEASLLVCNLYTCKSTKFLQEDNIDAIIKYVQFQLRETIFPSYDPVYTFETKKKVS